jgi:hypothetical protein
MDIELVILCVVMALYIGWKASEAWHLHVFNQLMDDLNVSHKELRKIARAQGIEIPEPESDLPILELRIEKHPEGLFAYRKEDGFFIAMGKDKDSLMENIVNNLNNVRVVVAKEDGGDLISS